jgi:hypothetical protein
MNDTVVTEDQEQPAKGYEHKARVGDKDPDRRTSSRPRTTIRINRGRTYDRSRPNRSKRQKVLARGGRPHMTLRWITQGLSLRSDVLLVASTSPG